MDVSSSFLTDGPYAYDVSKHHMSMANRKINAGKALNIFANIGFVLRKSRSAIYSCFTAILNPPIDRARWRRAAARRS
jgi:hypothetical protein